jgi:hypothetical protein
MPALIDLPRAVVDSELLVVSGLVAWPIAIAAMVAVNGMAIAHESHQHPDVSAAMPQFPFTAGLTAVADLRVPPLAHARYHGVDQSGSGAPMCRGDEFAA